MTKSEFLNELHWWLDENGAFTSDEEELKLYKWLKEKGVSFPKWEEE